MSPGWAPPSAPLPPGDSNSPRFCQRGLWLTGLMLALVLWGTWCELWTSGVSSGLPTQPLPGLDSSSTSAMSAWVQSMRAYKRPTPLGWWTQRVRKSSRHYRVESAAVTPHEKDYIYRSAGQKPGSIASPRKRKKKKKAKKLHHLKD